MFRENNKTLSSSSFSSSSSSSSYCVSLRIKEDDKFFSKLLSRDQNSCSSLDNVYYGGSRSSIPFTWESRPGTPKNPTEFSSETYYPASSDIVPDLIPPLTPPPISFLSSSSLPATPSIGGAGKKRHNSSISGIGSKVKTSGNPRARFHTMSLSSATSSSPTWTWSGSGSGSGLGSGSGSYSSASTTTSKFTPDLGADSVHITDFRTQRSPDSTLNFGSRRKKMPSGNKLWACSPVAKVKRALLSIVGRRTTSSRHDVA